MSDKSIPTPREAVDLGELTKTSIRRMEQHRDRWSSFGGQTGIRALSDKPSADTLRDIEIFRGLDDSFLESISPDISLAHWDAGSVLFEQGTYLDLAFYVLDGQIEVYFGSGDEATRSQALPIFDHTRTAFLDASSLAEAAKVKPAQRGLTTVSKIPMPERKPGEDTRKISFLSTFDFDLQPGEGVQLGPGELLGEIGAMSGWPQSATARTMTECRLVQIRVPALRALKRKSPQLKERLDALYRQRALHGQLNSTPLFRELPPAVMAELESDVELISLDPDQVLVAEGQQADALYLVRSGFLKLGQRYGEGELVVTYLSKGMTLGEVELMVDGIATYEVTATSVEYAELVRLPYDRLRGLLESQPSVQRALWKATVGRLKELGAGRNDPGRSDFIETALEQGLVQGNSIFLIDLDRCTRCDDCVRACAATHGGRPRFVREGERLDRFLVPKSCYHCRDPVCLVGCPTGAIHRAGLHDWVSITDEICIGCGTCSRNCPYDAIVMHDTGETWPDDMVPTLLRGRPRQVASKCDQCGPAGHDPACVSNCPQACAYRVGSIDEIRSLMANKEGEG
ncbi:MAG: cyclic nucleotide-binding domain-containing protein [Thermoanaerobaculia bacterium]|nr:cyclic nucleotide-binding domain-containing protein [Thermoanaerobaculia bacterium]